MAAGSVVHYGQPLSVGQRRRLSAAAQQHGKAVVVGSVFDTIKRVHDGLVIETVDRGQLSQPLAWACTPGNEPSSDPPRSDWFVGAVAVE